jgi:hypothetical protein
MRHTNDPWDSLSCESRSDLLSTGKSKGRSLGRCRESERTTRRHAEAAFATTLQKSGAEAARTRRANDCFGRVGR